MEQVKQANTASIKKNYIYSALAKVFALLIPTKKYKRGGKIGNLGITQYWTASETK